MAVTFALSIQPVIVAQGSLPDTAGESESEVRSAFQRYQELTSSFDPDLAEFYSADARIHLRRVSVDGKSREIELSGTAYRKLIRASMGTAKARGDLSLFIDVTFSKDGEFTRVNATRYSVLKKYSVPHVLKFARGSTGKWLIVEERAELREASGHEFMNVLLGFSIRKPADWTFKSAEQLSTVQQDLVLEDKEFEAAIKRRAAKPFVVFMKDGESDDAVFPTVQVNARLLPKSQEELEFLEVVSETMGKGFTDYQVLRKPRAQKVSGLPGAAMKVRYTLANSERSFEVMARMWVVRRGRVVFIIGMSGPPTERIDRTFLEIYDSIRIQGAAHPK